MWTSSVVAFLDWRSGVKPRKSWTLCSIYSSERVAKNAKLEVSKRNSDYSPTRGKRGYLIPVETARAEIGGTAGID